jgi:hypothetical protein
MSAKSKTKKPDRIKYVEILFAENGYTVEIHHDDYDLDQSFVYDDLANALDKIADLV